MATPSYHRRYYALKRHQRTQDRARTCATFLRRLGFSVTPPDEQTLARNVSAYLVECPYAPRKDAEGRCRQ